MQVTKIYMKELQDICMLEQSVVMQNDFPDESVNIKKC